MRITRRPSPSGVAGLEDAGTIAPSTPAPASPSETGRNDRVNLSDAARLRQRVRSDLGDLEQTDSARVASLRARVTADTYKPAPEAVAKSLIGELTADLLV
jgi:anti-sigma28 factor (negative regulator of flagellin synthesis)